MSANPSANPSSLDKQGEFHAKKPGSEPLTTTGHAVGIQVGNDRIPTFQTQTVPAGSAPKDQAFKSNPQSSGTGGSDGSEQEYSADATTNASDTLGGSTSQDVHQGLGKPVGPQSSSQLNSAGDNVKPGKKDGQGLVGLDNVTDAKNAEGRKKA